MLIAKEDGLLKRDKKADRGKSKEEIKDEEEKVLRQVLYVFIPHFDVCNDCRRWGFLTSICSGDIF
jgi:hypothetical protein